MGVHDFVCFIQGNGQCIRGYVSTEHEKMWHAECCGGVDRPTCDDVAINEEAVMATVVTLPASMRDELPTLNLHEFRKYPAEEADYSWDSWDFIDHFGETGYFDSLQSDDNRSYWIAGESLHVVFQTDYYNAFVQGNDPEAVGWATYDEIFGNRFLPTPQTKKEAWDTIVGQKFIRAINAGTFFAQ